MLVRDQVVGIVAAGPVIEERSHRLAFEKTAGERAVVPGRRARSAVEHAGDVLRSQRTAVSAFCDGHAGGECEARGVEFDAIVAASDPVATPTTRFMIVIVTR